MLTILICLILSFIFNIFYIFIYNKQKRHINELTKTNEELIKSNKNLMEAIYIYEETVRLYEREFNIKSEWIN